MTPIRVLIADEHATMRAGLRMALDGHGFQVVAEAATSGDAVEAALRELPDLCLLDVDMPGEPVTAAAEIARLSQTEVVMLASSADDESLFAALGAGARGFLLKGMDSGRLPHALRGVMDGEPALPRVLVSRVLDEFRQRVRSTGALEQAGVRLTSREWEILQLLADDLSTKQIAERLSISPVTVRRHVSAVLRRLDVPNREAAVAMLESYRDQE